MNNKRGFTLIELMAVISIITLFSSIVLVAINNVRDNARIAGSKQFSSHVIGQLGDNLVSYWSFESASNLGKDFWGSNDGALVLGPTQVDGVIGKGLSFNGSNYIDFGNKSSLNFGTGPFTIEFWVKRSSIIAWQRIISKDEDPPGWVVRFDNANQISFVTRGGITVNSTTVINDTNNWYYVVITRDNSGLKKIFIDGSQEPNTATYTGDVSCNANFLIGPINGFIDEVRVYSAALTVQQVQQRYAESAPRHGVAIK